MSPSRSSSSSGRAGRAPRIPAGVQQRQRLPDLAHRRQPRMRCTSRSGIRTTPSTILPPRSTRARAVGGTLPVVIAAYQHIYDSATGTVADRSTALTMATLFSHGATHLLAGEADRILVDPYYVRNHVVESSTAALLRRWYDFLVEHDELLLPAGYRRGDRHTGRRVQRRLRRPIDAVAAVSEEASPGTVWRRITPVGDGLVVHLINLLGQTDSLWDAERRRVVRPGSGELRFRRVRGRSPRGAHRRSRWRGTSARRAGSRRR